MLEYSRQVSLKCQFRKELNVCQWFCTSLLLLSSKFSRILLLLYCLETLLSEITHYVSYGTLNSARPIFIYSLIVSFHNCIPAFHFSICGF